jgi:hypothetical protein
MHVVPGGANGKQELLNYDPTLSLCYIKRNERSEERACKKGRGVQLITFSFIKE